MREYRVLNFSLLLVTSAAVALSFGCNQGSDIPALDRSETRKVEPVEKISSTTSGPVKYVALGDSTGAGVGAKDGGYVARLYKRLLEHRPGSQLSNLCVSGATSADVVRDQLNRSIGAEPELVTLGIGINDIGHGFTLEQFSDNLDKILSTLKGKTKAQIVVSNIPDISSSARVPAALRMQSQFVIMQYNERLAEIAARYGVTVFDIYKVTHEQLPNHPEYFSADGFHPSDAGYELWAERMWPTVARATGIE